MIRVIRGAGEIHLFTNGAQVMLKDLVAGLWRRSRSRSGLSKTARAEAVVAAAVLETLEQRRLLTVLTLPTATTSAVVTLTSGGTMISATIWAA